MKLFPWVAHICRRPTNPHRTDILRDAPSCAPGMRVRSFVRAWLASPLLQLHSNDATPLVDGR